MGDGIWQSVINGRNTNVYYARGSEFDDIIAGDHDFDYIYGHGGNDILEGRGGNDGLGGGEGDDTYIYTVGDGDDRISESFTNGGEDTLRIFVRFAQTDLTDDLRFFRKGNDLQI